MTASLFTKLLHSVIKYKSKSVLSHPSHPKWAGVVLYSSYLIRKRADH